MPDCKACGKWFAAMEQCELCPTCERALERLSNYAAPVVRCKDCKYSYADLEGLCCTYGPPIDCIVPGDYGCVYGKRRASDGE